MADVAIAPNASGKPDPLAGLDGSERRQLAARLAAARRHVGLRQDDVAGALGLSISTVSAIECGKRRIAPLELRRLARLYCCPIGWLLGEEPESPESLLRATAKLYTSDQREVHRFAEIWAGAARPS